MGTEPFGELFPRKTDTPPLWDGGLSDWIWAAGIYEGEGSVSKNHKSLQVVIVQKDPFILHRLKQFCGGSIAKRCNKGFECFALYLYGKAAMRFLRRTKKYLSPRRRDQIIRVWALEDL
jgi:hypothetical protein